MIVKCPVTGKDIPSEDINVALDTVFSRHCGRVFSLSQLLKANLDTTGEDAPFRPPPKMCRVFETAGGVKVVEFRQRRFVIGIVFVLLGAFFSLGLGPVLVAGAATGSFINNTNGNPVSTPVALGIGLAGAASLICGLSAAWMGLFMIAGRQRVYLNSMNSVMRVLIGPFTVFRRRVALLEDAEIVAGYSSWFRFNNQPMMTIKIESSLGYTTINTMISSYDPEPVEFAVRMMNDHVESLST